jgi:pimeloyl-ACP methyl ester carboxylesterase
MGRVALPSGFIGLTQLPQIGGGPARDLVMIHGLGANSGFWYASAVRWFRRFGRVTLFDLPGHGESDMPQTGYEPGHLAGVLGELLDHLQISQAHLFAHSFGGTVALSFASRQPRRVASLILADARLWAFEPPALASASGPRLHRLRDAGLALTDLRFDVSIQVLVELARLRLEKDDPGSAVREALPGASNLFRGRRAAARWLKLIETTRAYEEMTDPGGLSAAEIERVEQPILAVYGELSARKQSALALQRYCPHCELRVVPNVGHFFPLTRPRLFARPAVSFLRSIAGGKVSASRNLPNPPAPIDLPELPPFAEVAT